MPKLQSGPGTAAPDPDGSPPTSKDAVLKQARRWCRQARPIFICGPARSGTSILTVSFAKHSQLFTPRGVAETFAFANPQALRDKPLRKGVKKYLVDQANVRRFQSLVATVEREGRLFDDEIIQLFFFFAGTNIYPGLRPLEKTPGHVSHLDSIFDIFPLARVVVSLRDPVDIVSSYRKRLQQEQASGADRSVWGWLDKSPDRLVNRFRAITRDLTAVDDRHADQVFLAPYGWVTADAPAALDTLMRFLDLPIEQGMAEGRASAADPDGNGLEVKRLAEPITARASERHSYLSADEIRFVETETDAIRSGWRHAGPLAQVRADQGFFVPERKAGGARPS
jgi:hypothetical protein